MLPVLINDTPVDCINLAAIAYHVPATVILSVIKQENGRNGQAVKNKNGSFDYGVMGVNSIWLPAIAKYGYTKEQIQFNACKNVEVGTWILSQSIAGSETFWNGVGNYNSHTPVFNRVYRTNIHKHFDKILQVLNISPFMPV